MPAIRNVLAAIAVSLPAAAGAFSVPVPCDSVTGAGYVFKDSGGLALFAVEAGCKHGAFWGGVDYVDLEQRFYFESTRITGYTFDPSNPNARGICGVGRINGSRTEYPFRAHVDDNGEPGRDDTFGILILGADPSDRYLLLSRPLAGFKGRGGGNIQLHKPNKSTKDAPAFDESMCGGVPQPETPR